MNKFCKLFQNAKPVIGMIHLPPLPDYESSPGIDHVIQHALADLDVLEQNGADGVLVENEYDRPHRVDATSETVEAMTQVTGAVVAASKRTIVGCEILLNDPRASLDVAKNAGAKFIRSDYFVDLMTRPEYGEFRIDPDGLIAYRSSIGAEDVCILADIQVKYASMISDRPLGDSAKLACEKQADAIVVTGDASGDAPTVVQLQAASEAAHYYNTPVLIGSGLDANNAAKLFNACNGAIVGSSIMTDRAVDAAAMAILMQSLGRTLL